MVGGFAKMDWQFQKAGWKDNNPLGKLAEDFIMENPQYLLYFRRLTEEKCPHHWDLASSSPKFLGQKCTICWGFGVKTLPQLVPGRLSFGPGDVGRETTTKGVPGYAEYFTTILHLPRAIKPNLNDVVCVCEWSKATQNLGSYPLGRVLKVTAVYQIKTTNDYFERELSYYSCGLEIYDIFKGTLDEAVPKLQNIPIINPEVAWQQNSYW